jgi:hypothetical protein
MLLSTSARPPARVKQGLGKTQVKLNRGKAGKTRENVKMAGSGVKTNLDPEQHQQALYRLLSVQY